MFDHLDDPDPYVPDARVRARVLRRGRSLRRRRRLAVGGLGCTVVLLVGIAGSMGFADRRLDDIDRVEVASVGDPAEPSAPQVVLFAGVDTDDGLEPADPLRDPARDPSRRSDTIVVLRIDPTARTLTVLPLPRDLWVEIPGHGPGRINSALPLGGPDLLVATVEQSLGLDVDRYVETDFAGAIAVADAVGGVRLAFPTAVRDQMSGFAHPGGCETVDGRDLLALGRARHLEALEDGRWVADPTSDLGRIERQQAIFLAMLDRLRAVDATDPIEAAEVLDAMADHLVVDASMSNGEVVSLFRTLQETDPTQLRLPVTDAVRGGAAILDLAEGADGVLEAFRSGTAAPENPAGPGGSTEPPAAQPLATTSC